MKKKVVLAYSGGLDTSFCCIYLTQDLGYEVHSVIVNTGGFSDEELKGVEERAYKMGVTSHHVVDETKNFYNTCVRFLISVVAILCELAFDLYVFFPLCLTPIFSEDWVLYP